MARVASMVGLSVLLCGCKQLFNIDEASSPAVSDGPIVEIDMAVDQPIDMPLEAGAPVTVTFRNGDNGNSYQGTVDTMVESGAPNVNNGGDTQLTVRKSDRSALIQFTQIFGAAAGQIPNGAAISSATLDLDLQQVNSTGTIYEMTIAWAEDVTFNTLGGSPGITGDFGASVAAFAPISGLNTFDVTTTVAKWAAGTLDNNGWIIVGENNDSDSKLRSSEDGIATNRPALHVTYQLQ